MMSTDNESPRILRVAETTSTNSLLRELIIKESLSEGSVVVAPSGESPEKKYAYWLKSISAKKT